MKILHPRELRAADLPALESPFFAAEKARNLLHNSCHQDLERLLGKPPGFSQGARAFYRQRAALTESVLREISGGRLFLVIESVDGEPSAPVVLWREDHSGAGRWEVTESNSHPEIISGVAAMNQCGITPRQLSGQTVHGIGGLPASNFGMEYRLRQREEALRKAATPTPHASQVSRTITPVSPGAKPTQSNTKEPPPEIHLEIGIFTDGTLNNAENSRELEERVATECAEAFERGDISEEECGYRLGLMMGGSYGNAPSNVAKLARSYDDSSTDLENRVIHRLWVYAPGIGTKTGEGDSLVGSISGMGETGVVSQVRSVFANVAERVAGLEFAGAISSMTIDLFGFSRGAASARHAVNEIQLGQNGALGEAFRNQRIDWPGQTVIRFVGIFDTVAAIVNPYLLDFAPGNGRNEPVRISLDPTHIGAAVHLVAGDECRQNFSLNSLRSADGSLAENFREISLPGAHSDIGGGYQDAQREDVLVSPYHIIPTDRNRWPEQTMEWDNLRELRRKVASEGWLGAYSLPVQPSEDHDPAPAELGPESMAYLEIYKKFSAHPAPDGRVELALRMVRQVRGEYSRIPLKVMHELAKKAGVPFNDIGESESTRLPDELTPVADKIIDQILSGSDSPSLNLEQQALIRERYTHCSANYNPLRTMIGGLVATLRLGRNFSPNAPVDSGERVIHPNNY